MSDFLKVGDVFVIQKTLKPSELEKLENVLLSEEERTVVEGTLKNSMTIIKMFGVSFWYSDKVKTSYSFPLSRLEWKCEKSPWGICIYDHEKDSMHDQCLICGEPEERK